MDAMNYLLLIIGLAILIVGANILIDSASKLAKSIGIPAYIIGLTIVAFGTSAPELAVGVTAGISGTNQLSLGTVVGSSIANIALVIGAAAAISPIVVDRLIAKRELPLSFLIQVALTAMVLTGFIIQRWEAVIFVLGFIIFMFWLIRETKKFNSGKQCCSEAEKDLFGFLEKESEEEVPEKINKLTVLKSILLFIAGLAMLIFGSDMVVGNAKTIAEFFGLSQEFIGLTVVAVGTSLPELTATIVASTKNEDQIAIGNIVGSNIFNILLVLGVSASISPVVTNFGVLTDFVVMLAATVMLFIPSFFKHKISRTTGVIMIMFYVSYISLKIFGVI